MTDRILLSNLLCKVQDFVNTQNYCKGTWYYYHAAINHMKRFYQQKQFRNYSPELSWECVLERRKQYEFHKISYCTFLYTWKIAEMLKDLHFDGVITYRNSQTWKKVSKPILFIDILENYKQHKLKNGYSPNTVTGETSEVRQFLEYIENLGYNNLSQIQRHDIFEYLNIVSSKRVSGMSDCLTRLRSFFRYLIETGQIPELLLSTLQMKTPIHKKIHMGFSTSESEAIIQSIDRNTDVGKRDYAMLLLAQNTGLRAIDIINLKLRDIDWHNKQINIIQHKTQRPIMLPLENIVGNAIAEYILNARPKSDYENVFLKSRIPYTPLKQGIGAEIVRKYIKRSGICLSSNVRQGFHSFRRAIGVRMLSANIPLSTVSEVLGHSKISSTKPYISIATESLRICAMPMTGFECVRKELL